MVQDCLRLVHSHRHRSSVLVARSLCSLLMARHRSSVLVARSLLSFLMARHRGIVTDRSTLVAGRKPIGVVVRCR